MRDTHASTVEGEVLRLQADKVERRSSNGSDDMAGNRGKQKAERPTETEHEAAQTPAFRICARLRLRKLPHSAPHAAPAGQMLLKTMGMCLYHFCVRSRVAAMANISTFQPAMTSTPSHTSRSASPHPRLMTSRPALAAHVVGSARLIQRR